MTSQSPGLLCTINIAREIMEEENKYISDLLIRYVNGLYTRNDIETLRKLAASITKRAELESEMDRVWNEAQDLPQSDSHNHLLYKKEAQDLLDKTRKRERRISLSTFIKYAASIALSFPSDSERNYT